MYEINYNIGYDLYLFALVDYQVPTMYKKKLQICASSHFNTSFILNTSDRYV